MNGSWKIRCVLMLLLASVTRPLYAQPAQYAFKITFSDKTGAPPISSASSFLSQRALDRRSQQGLAVDSTDRPVSPVYISDVLATTGGVYHVASRWLNTFTILLTDSSKILTLTGKPYITDIKYTGFYRPILHNKLNGDANGGAQAKTSGDIGYYGAAFAQTQLVNGDFLHDRGFKGQGKLIAVLDAGFSSVNTGPAFDSIFRSGRIVDTWDFAHAVSNVYDYSSHGTQCLSTMAGNLPGIYVGSAPMASYALYTTEIEGGDQPVEMDQMVAGIERADSAGADVISASIGYNNFQGPVYSTLTYADIDGKTTAPAKAVNMATAKGILCVITAGNEGGGSPWPYILTPGDADSALTVGSVGINKEPAGNSGYGPNSAGRVKPDVCLLGNLASVMLGSATPQVNGGTSFSTPQLAGWAACLLQATSGATPYKLRSAINSSAHIYPAHEKQLGYGVPDFYKASQYMGIDDLPKGVDAVHWLNVYPNPFDDKLNVWLYVDETTNVDISLTDVNGKKISSDARRVVRGTQLMQLTIPQMPSGNYYLNAKGGNKTATVKVLKH